MGVDANPITLTWMGGIGFSAIIAIFMLYFERTKVWSDKKIVGIATLLGFILILGILRIIGMI